jgi:hypothetical protein
MHNEEYAMHEIVVAGVETGRAPSLPGGGRNKKSVVLQRKSGHSQKT